MKILRLVLALMLAVTLMTFAAGTSFATTGSTIVDQKADIMLVSKVGAMGTAQLELKINEGGVLDLFRIKVDAEGLVPGGTYTLFLGKHLLACAIADEGGKASWDVRLDMFHKTTLEGLKITVVYGKTLMDPVALYGKVMAGDIIQ